MKESLKSSIKYNIIGVAYYPQTKSFYFHPPSYAASSLFFIEFSYHYIFIPHNDQYIVRINNSLIALRPPCVHWSHSCTIRKQKSVLSLGRTTKRSSNTRSIISRQLTLVYDPELHINIFDASVFGGVRGQVLTSECSRWLQSIMAYKFGRFQLILCATAAVKFDYQIVFCNNLFVQLCKYVGVSVCLFVWNGQWFMCESENACAFKFADRLAVEPNDLSFIENACAGMPLVCSLHTFTHIPHHIYLLIHLSK